MFSTITQARRAAYASIIIAVIGLAAAWTFAVRSPAFADGCRASAGTQPGLAVSGSLHGSTATSVATKSGESVGSSHASGRAAGSGASSRTSGSSLINISAPVNSGRGESTEGSLTNVSAPANTSGATSGSGRPLISVDAPVSASQSSQSSSGGLAALERIEKLLGDL